MRTLLICHHDSALDRDGLARWLASFSTLAGIVVITETGDTVKRRVRREWQRSGPLRFVDILAFRVYYKLVLGRKDAAWTRARCASLAERFPPHAAPVLDTAVMTTPEVEQFIAEAKPDIVVARCKHLLKRNIFSLASVGTFVMHPGICPEYRNAHGCFWALARRDLGRVGLTLLKIDAGVDTGLIYGHYTCKCDELTESHFVIQTRSVLDNLDGLAAKLGELAQGTARPIEVAGRQSAVWGQPWLSRYIWWKYRAWRERSCAR